MSAIAAFGVATAAVALEFPSPDDFNPTWESAKPGTSYSKALPTSALLGNGSLGAVNGGDGNCKKFVLTRGDLWSCGNYTRGYDSTNIIAISFADFSIGPGMHSVSSMDVLDLPTATLRTKGKFGKGVVSLESYVAADEDLFVVSGVSDADDSWNLRLITHNRRTEFPREAGVARDGFWVKRSTLNLLPTDDPRGWTTNATAAVCVLGAELEAISAPNCGEARGAVKIHANKPFALIVSANPGRRFTWGELAKIRASHEGWWKEWWTRSRIATGDAALDRFYCGQVYLLGAGVRQGKFPPGLYGIWVTTDAPMWHNDYHLNYNYASTYYGCFAANRCEVAETMSDPLIAYLPQATRNAKEILQSSLRRFRSREYLDRRPDLADGIEDAALFPVALGPWGTCVIGHWNNWGQVSVGALQCAVICTHWEYTLDRAYLMKVWPLLDKTANFFLKWCEKEETADGGYRYNVWDSHWEGSGLAKNSAAALGFVRHLFETLVEAAPVLREMGVDVPDAKVAAWTDLRDHLAGQPVEELPVDGKNVRMFVSTVNAKWPTNLGGGSIFLENVVPGENFSFDISDETRALAVNAIDATVAMGGTRVWTCSNQTPKLFAHAARVGYPIEPVIKAFKEHQLRLMQKNFHIHDGVHGVEKIGAMEFVQSMFIQCDHGFVKVFPNWTGADAKFENLRAKGCFLVSAEMKGGKVVRVRVKSEKGGRFRIVDPWVGRSPRDRRPSSTGKMPVVPVPPPGWTCGMTRNSGEATLERDFNPGEIATLEPNRQWGIAK